MKVILERPDCIRILEEHFGSKFEEGDILIRADPLEIEIRNVPVPASEKNAAPAPVSTPTAAIAVSARDLEAPTPVANASADDRELVERRADANASADPPPPGDDEMGSMAVSGSPMSVIQQSRELQAQLDRERQANNGGLQRQMGPNVSLSPPTNFENEV